MSKSLILAVLALSSLVAAQQQAPMPSIQPAGQPIQQPAAGPTITNIPLIPAQISAPIANCSEVTKKPTPETKKYTLNSCIVAQFATYFSTGPGKYIEFKNGVVNKNVSQCDNSTVSPVKNPKLVVDFDCGQVAFDVNHTNDSHTFVSVVSGKYILNGTDYTFADSTPRFSTTQSGHYFKCNTEQAVPFQGNLSLYLSNFALEAYRDVPGTDFYQIVEECPLDSQPVSDLVRIGVGVCLVALVAIVLIAYFIGRRRWSERSSYESV